MKEFCPTGVDTNRNRNGATPHSPHLTRLRGQPFTGIGRGYALSTSLPTFAAVVWWDSAL